MNTTKNDLVKQDANTRNVHNETRTIYKRFKRLQDAERHQSLLYGKFNSVQLIDFPRYSQEGLYAWRVS